MEAFTLLLVNVIIGLDITTINEKQISYILRFVGEINKRWSVNTSVILYNLSLVFKPFYALLGISIITWGQSEPTFQFKCDCLVHAHCMCKFKLPILGLNFRITHDIPWALQCYFGYKKDKTAPSNR